MRIRKVFYPCTNCRGDFLIATKELTEAGNIVAQVYNYSTGKYQLIDTDLLSPLPMSDLNQLEP